jgi:hypothetical protein
MNKNYHRIIPIRAMIIKNHGRNLLDNCCSPITTPSNVIPSTIIEKKPVDPTIKLVEI